MRVLSRAFFWTQLMHYYQFNVADYRKDTVHLTPIEHYVYRTLIDWYYLDETPIPLETDSVLRRIRLGFDNEENLLNVLTDFFKKESDGWHHVRIDKEIVAYHANAVKNKANGMLGGRPKKTQSVTVGLPDETQVKGNQEPLTNNHKPITNNHKPSTGEVCLAIKENGIIDVNPSNPTLIKLIEAGATVNNFADAAKVCNVKKFAYLLKVIESDLEKASNLNVKSGVIVSKQQKREEDLQWFLGNQTAIEKDITHG